MNWIVALLATAVLLTGSINVHAQHTQKLHRIGFLATTSSSSFEAFRQGLKELGYVDGKNVIIEARFADGRLERLPAAAAELIGLKVDVLVAGSPAAAVAAMRASATVPIVFAGVLDPVASGLVTNLAQPGGNVTGIAAGTGGAAFGGKWLELLKEVLPTLSHVAVLANRSNRSNSPYLEGVQAAARASKLKISIFDAANRSELDRALAAITASGAQGLVVTPDPFLFAERTTVVQFAANRRLPAIYFFRQFADAGGLMTYGASLDDSYRRSAMYVDKILNGAKAGALPVEQPTKFELVINLRSARALGLMIPPALLARADHVVD